MNLTRRSFRRNRFKRAHSKRARSKRRTSKSYMKKRRKTFKRIKGGDIEDEYFPLVVNSQSNDQTDAGNELLDYVYNYVIHCYLKPNKISKVRDTRNGILNVFLGDKTATYNISGIDLIKKNSCPSRFSYSARKNCEIKKSWAYFLIVLILSHEIGQTTISANEYNPKIQKLSTMMKRSIVGISPQIEDPAYNLNKLLDSESVVLNSITDTTTRKIISDILQLIKTKSISKTNIIRMQKHPLLVQTIREGNNEEDDTDTDSE